MLVALATTNSIASAKTYAAHPKTNSTTNDAISAAIVLLAPQRQQGSLWNIDRFCLLLHSVQSVDRHLNAHFGPYPIHILVAKDYDQDPTGKDGLYSDEDRATVKKYAPHSQIHFVEIAMYSGDALEPGVSREEILAWREGGNGGIGGRDLGYTSMCRLWSGRLQCMSFLDRYKYYMRVDDDGLLTKDLTVDPFIAMEQNGLTYAFRRTFVDTWGKDQLWEATQPLLPSTIESLPMILDMPSGLRGRENRRRDVQYSGDQPYNNFHVARVDFWRTPMWQKVFRVYNEQHLFFKYRVGDAMTHAMALVMMGRANISIWSDFPYGHNTNDLKTEWWSYTQAWKQECQRDHETAAF